MGLCSHARSKQYDICEKLVVARFKVAPAAWVATTYIFAYLILRLAMTCTVGVSFCSNPFSSSSLGYFVLIIVRVPAARIVLVGFEVLWPAIATLTDLIRVGEPCQSRGCYLHVQEKHVF